jgi:hypothetical protein
MTDEAAAAWSLLYDSLGENTEGLAAEVTARAAPQVIRMALIYAVLDNSAVIDVPHLRAAVAVWEYCEGSARQIFRDAIGDPITDTILAALRHSPMSRTEIRELVGHHCSGGQISDALATLLKYGKARCEKRETGGRSSEIWIATNEA